MFNALIVCYLFLGGAGSGALVVLSVLEFVRAGSVRSGSSRFAIPRSFFERCWPLCCGVLFFGIMCLLVDLGRPERILGLLTSPTLSVVAVGAYCLAATLFCSLAFTVLALFENTGVGTGAIRVFAVVGIACGIASSTYTGLLLQSMVSVLFWNNPLLPALFLLSSLSTGIAVLFIGASFVDSRVSPACCVKKLARADAVVIVLEGACLTELLLISSSEPGAHAALQALVAGDLGWMFWGGIVVCGLAVPFVLEWFLSARNYRMQILWIAVLVLIGGLLLRVCIVGAGAYDATQSSAALHGLAAVASGEKIGV